MIPTDVLPYHPGRRQGPKAIHLDVDQLVATNPILSKAARETDLGWIICQQPLQDTLFDIEPDQLQVIPAWTGFNVNLQENNVLRENSVGYCQVIEASLTELPTVYTVLQRSLQLADQLGQHDVIVVFDQAIYAKALEVMWQNEEQFRRVVLRMGTFHTICAFTAAIGKRFGEAGLVDILVESGIVGSGSVAGVLEGRHYNRAVRMHKV